MGVLASLIVVKVGVVAATKLGYFAKLWLAVKAYVAGLTEFYIAHPEFMIDALDQ
jgi:hypothetical protein